MIRTTGFAASTAFNAAVNTTLNATSNVSSTNSVVITVKLGGSNVTTMTGYTIKVADSASSASTGWSTTTYSTANSETTYTVTGAMVPGTDYYIWAGKDANHKSDLAYSGVSFKGAASQTAEIKDM